MLNSNLSGTTQVFQKSFNQRLKHLEDVLGTITSDFQVTKLTADEAEVKKAVFEYLEAAEALITKLKAEEADIAKLAATEGRIDKASLGEAVVDGEIAAAKASVQAVEADRAAVGALTVEGDTELNSLRVKGSAVFEDIIEILNARTIEISSREALSSIAGAVLKLGAGFDSLFLSSQSRPEWNNEKLATLSDVRNPFTLQGIVATPADLPTSTAMSGDAYFVETPNELAIWSGAAWMEIEYPTLAAYRTSSAQDEIDAAINARIDSISVEAGSFQDELNRVEGKVDSNKAEQDIKNEGFDSSFATVAQEQAAQDAEIAKRLTDAPADHILYGRKDNEWAAINTSTEFLNKSYESREQFFTDKRLVKNAQYNETSALIRINGTAYYVGLWRVSPAETEGYEYTTRNMYDFVQLHKEEIDAVNQFTVQAVVAAYDGNHIAEFTDGTVDTATAFQTVKDGNQVKRSDGRLIGVTDLTNDENGFKVDTSIGFTATTPTVASPEESVINRKYLYDNLEISTASTTENASSAVLSYQQKAPDFSLAKANIWGSIAAGVNGAAWCASNWHENRNKIRTKNYVYMKYTNTEAHTANTPVWWISYDADGNTVNMTSPRDDRTTALAQATVCASWLGFHPDSWSPDNQDMVYWPHCEAEDNGGGYISIYNNGRFAGYVEDAEGSTNNQYITSIENYEYRYTGGKSLRSLGKQRILIVNMNSDAVMRKKAYVIGIDANGVEGLNKGRSAELPAAPTFGCEGIAAGKNNWVFQAEQTNQMVIVNHAGVAASYVLVDPVDQTALTATGISNAEGNFIELENGDAMFAVRDKTKQMTYFVYYHDDFEATGVEPFDVYRSATDWTNALTAAGEVAARQFPFVEHGDYIYFFGHSTHAFGGTAQGNLVDAAHGVTYSRFSKSSKTWADNVAPWTNTDAQGGLVAYKTYDPDENQDYLWVFQSNWANSASVPTQAQCMVISETGAVRYVDLGTGSGTHWFDSSNTIGDTVPGSSRPYTNSNTAYQPMWRWNIPYVNVTQQGVGIMLSSNFRDVCVFYGNGKFAVFSYNDAVDGGPWPLLTAGIGVNNCQCASVLQGKYGVRVAMLLNAACATSYGDASQWVEVYIKPQGSDNLSEPVYFMKHGPDAWLLKAWQENYEGAFYEKTDMSNYSSKLQRKVNPIYGRTAALVSGAGWFEYEGVPKTSKLFLRDGPSVISSAEL